MDVQKIRLTNGLLEQNLFVCRRHTVIFFYCGILIWFWYQDNTGPQKGVWQCSLFRVWGLTWTVFWMFGSIHQSSHLVLDFSLFGIFHYCFNLCTNSDFLFLCDSLLIGCVFPEIYPFLLECQICCCIIVLSSLLWSFVFLWCLL